MKHHQPELKPQGNIEEKQVRKNLIYTDYVELSLRRRKKKKKMKRKLWEI